MWLHWFFIATRGIFSWGMQTLICSMWDLVLWPGMEPGPTALGEQSVNCWTPRMSLQYFWLCWVFTAEGIFSLVEGWGSSSCVHASHCGGFSCGAQALGHVGSVVMHKLSCPLTWIVLDKGLNPCPLHWQANPVDNQGSSLPNIFDSWLDDSVDMEDKLYYRFVLMFLKF